MKKRILSFLLAALMILSTIAVLPFTVAAAEDAEYQKVARAYWNYVAGCWYNDDLQSYILFGVTGQYSPRDDNNQYYFRYGKTNEQGQLRWSETIPLNKQDFLYEPGPETYWVTLTIMLDTLSFTISTNSTDMREQTFLAVGESSRYEGIVDPGVQMAEYSRMLLTNDVLNLFDRYTFTSDNMKVYGGRDSDDIQTLEITFNGRTTTRSAGTFLYGKSDNPEYDYCFYYKGEPSEEKFYFSLNEAGGVDTLVFTDGSATYVMNKMTCDAIWDNASSLTFKPTGAEVQGWNGNILFKNEGTQRKMTLPNGDTINADTDLIVSQVGNQLRLMLKNNKNVYFVYYSAAGDTCIDLYQNGSKTQTFRGGYDIAAVWDKVNGKMYTNGDKSYSFTEEGGKQYVVVNGTNSEIGSAYLFNYNAHIGYYLYTLDEDRIVLVVFDLKDGKVNRLGYYPDYENEPENCTWFEAPSINGIWALINGRSYHMEYGPTMTFALANGAPSIIFNGSTEDIDAAYNIAVENGTYVLTKRSNTKVKITLAKNDEGKIVSVVYEDGIEDYDTTKAGTYDIVTLPGDFWEEFKDEAYKEYVYGDDGQEYRSGYIFFYEEDGKKVAKLNGTETLDLDACAIAEVSSNYSYTLTLADGRTLSLYRGWMGSSNTITYVNGGAETTYAMPDFSDITSQLHGTFENGANSIVFATKTDEDGWEGLFISVNGSGADTPAFFLYWLELDAQGRYVLVSEDEESGTTTKMTLIEKNGEFVKILYNDGNGEVEYVSPSAQPDNPGQDEPGTDEPADEPKKPEFPTETVTTSKEELKEGVSVAEAFKTADSKAEDTGVEIKIGGAGEKSGSIVFTPEAIAQIVAAIGTGDAKLKVEIETDPAKIETSGKISAETAEQVQLVVELDLGGVEFSNGAAEISLPFTAEVPAGKRVVIYYVDANGNMTPLDTEYKDGMVSFATTHFSTYIAMFEDVPAGGLSVGAIIAIILGALVLLALIAYVVFFFLWKNGTALPAFLGFLAPSYEAINKALFKKEAKPEE